MKRLIAILIVLPVLLTTVLAQGTESRPVKVRGRKMGLAKPIVFESNKEVYGARLKDLSFSCLTTMAKDAKAWDGKHVQIRGKITSVCAKKGCWMVVEQGNQEIRVKFTGYKFFVPLDAAGKEIAAEGTVQVRVETEAERRHYAEDAGKSAEEIAAIKGDEVTMSFMADAVQMGTLPPIKKKLCCGKAEGRTATCCGPKTGHAKNCCGCCATPKPKPKGKGR